MTGAGVAMGVHGWDLGICILDSNLEGVTPKLLSHYTVPYDQVRLTDLLLRSIRSLKPGNGRWAGIKLLILGSWDSESAGLS